MYINRELIQLIMAIVQIITQFVKIYFLIIIKSMEFKIKLINDKLIIMFYNLTLI